MQVGRQQNFLFAFSLGKGIKEGIAQSRQGGLFFSSVLWSSLERSWAVSPNTESGDNRQMGLEISGIKIACRRKEKREVQKLLLFLTQVADPHQYALMLLSYPEVFVSLATTDPSHKALWERFVTRHANKDCKDQEPPEARMCPIKKWAGSSMLKSLFCVQRSFVCFVPGAS